MRTLRAVPPLLAAVGHELENKFSCRRYSQEFRPTVHRLFRHRVVQTEVAKVLKGKIVLGIIPVVVAPQTPFGVVATGVKMGLRQLKHTDASCVCAGCREQEYS